MKRPYKTVAVEPRGGAFIILLDDVPAATPRGIPFALPTGALGQAIAEEWRGHQKIAPLGPLTRLANSAIDRPREDIAAELMKYVDTDLLFYRAEEKPLAQRQGEGWDPLLCWARELYGAEFAGACGITPFAQPEATREALRSCHGSAVVLDRDKLVVFKITVLGCAFARLAAQQNRRLR